MLASFNLIDSMSNYGFYHQFMMGDRSLVPMIGGAILAILVGICIIGGGKQIVRITGVLVPFMGVFYILMAIAVMILNIGRLPEVFVNIFSNAFDFKAIFGGFAGSAMMQGIKRGLYSNEAGVGSAPNAAAAADVSHPVKQGLVQMLSVFIDTILICTATDDVSLHRHRSVGRAERRSVCTGIAGNNIWCDWTVLHHICTSSLCIHDAARQPVLL